MVIWFLDTSDPYSHKPSKREHGAYGDGGWRKIWDLDWEDTSFENYLFPLAELKVM